MIGAYRRLGIEDIRARLGPPDPMVEAKVVPTIGLTARRFIAHSPFAVLATASAAGADSSPRGDGPGFVKVLDERTLALPDRTGNNLADSLTNLLENPAIGVLFLIPGLRETLRINGQAYATDDPGLLERFTMDNRRPTLALVVDVEQVYFHCGKALIRSRLWDSATHSLASSMTMGNNVFSLQRIEQNSARETSAELAAVLERSYRTDL